MWSIEVVVSVLWKLKVIRGEEKDMPGFFFPFSIVVSLCMAVLYAAALRFKMLFLVNSDLYKKIKRSGIWLYGLN